MISRFLTDLNLHDLGNDQEWALLNELVYVSELLNYTLIVPKGFITDLASVPRVPPIVYAAWGNRAHYESVIHDYLYCIGAVPEKEYDEVNKVFLEAMTVRNKPDWIKWAMYAGVCVGGFTHWKNRYLDTKMWKGIKK
jgi:hypothetical protein